MLGKYKTVGILTLVAAIVLMVACNEEKPSLKKGFDIVGAWEMVRIDYPDGRIDTMDMGKYTRCKIYDADSTYSPSRF